MFKIINNQITSKNNINYEFLDEEYPIKHKITNAIFNKITYHVNFSDINKSNLLDYTLIYAKNLNGCLKFSEDFSYEFNLIEKCLVFQNNITCLLKTENISVIEIWNTNDYLIVIHPNMEKTRILISDIMHFKYENSIKFFLERFNIMYSKYTKNEFSVIVDIYMGKNVDIFNNYEIIDYYFGINLIN